MYQIKYHNNSKLLPNNKEKRNPRDSKLIQLIPREITNNHHPLAEKYHPNIKNF